MTLLPTNKETFDKQRCKYFECLWYEGAHVSWSGCQVLLQKRRHFPAASELVRTWKREEPSHRTHCCCPLRDLGEERGGRCLARSCRFWRALAYYGSADFDTI